MGLHYDTCEKCNNTFCHPHGTPDGWKCPVCTKQEELDAAQKEIFALKDGLRGWREEAKRNRADSSWIERL